MATDIGLIRSSTTGELYKFVAGSTTPDGIFVKDISSLGIAGETRARLLNTDVLTSTAANIFADGVDRHVAFQAAMDNALVGELKLYKEGGGTINLGSANINCNGKKLSSVPGTKITGTGRLYNFVAAFDDDVQVFADTTLTVEPITFANGYCSPHWWGAVPTAAADPTTAPAQIQAAIYAAVKSNTPWVHFTQTGTYNVSNLVIAKWTDTFQSQDCVFKLTGATSAGSAGQNGVLFYCTDVNAAIIHLQQVKNLVIRGIKFQGRINGAVGHVSVRTDAQWRAKLGAPGTLAIDNINSSHAGIAIDTFHSGVASGNRYPDTKLAPYYANTGGGSMGVEIRDCNFEDLMCGVIHGHSGQIFNGDNISVYGGQVNNVRSFIAAGQSQSRAGVVQDVNVVGSCKIFLNGGQYGLQNGSLPLAINCSINQSAYWYVNNTEFEEINFIGCYGEGIWAIGVSPTGFSQSFTHCRFKLAPSADARPAKYLVDSGGTINFIGGNIEHATVEVSQGAICIKAPQINLLGGFGRHGLIINRYTNASPNIWYRGYHYYNDTLSDNENTIGFPESFVRRLLSAGSTFISDIGRKYTRITAKVASVFTEVVTVTVNDGARTCSFTSATVGSYVFGDILVSDEFDAPIGFVSTIVGSVVTCAFTPSGLTTGSQTLRIYRQPIAQERLLGTTTSGSNVITSIVGINSFQVGEMVFGTGIPAASRVVSKTSTTMTISKNATASATKVQLYDAELTCEANESIFGYGVTWFNGDFIKNLAGGSIYGWRVSAPGLALSGAPPSYAVIQDVSSALTTLDTFPFGPAGTDGSIFSHVVPAGTVLERVWFNPTNDNAYLEISTATGGAFDANIIGNIGTDTTLVPINTKDLTDLRFLAKTDTTLYYRVSGAPTVYGNVTNVLSNII